MSELPLQPMSLKLYPNDIERLVTLIARLPMTNRALLAREAIRIGLDFIEADPAILLRTLQDKEEEQP